MDKPIRETVEAVTDPAAAARPDEGASETVAPSGTDGSTRGSDPGSSETIAASESGGATSSPGATGIGFDDA